jgi:hypothetical protein
MHAELQNNQIHSPVLKSKGTRGIDPASVSKSCRAKCRLLDHVYVWYEGKYARH